MWGNEIRRRRFLTALGAVGTSAVILPDTRAIAGTRAETVFIGSYTSTAPPGNGLDIARRTNAGEWHRGDAVDGVPDVSFLAWSPDRRFLYATNERDDGTVTAVDVTGSAPAVLNTRSTRGAGPTHLTVHPDGRYLLTANYTAGSVVVHRIRADGGIGPSTDLVRHEGGTRKPHAHQVLVDPSERWVTAVDLGADSVYVYAWDSDNGKLTRQQRLVLPTGSGPRHLAFHPQCTHAYLLSELESTITVLSWDCRMGKFTPGQVISTRSEEAGGENFPAEIGVSDDGRFVYASNRGDDDIATFATGDSPGELRFLGTTPTGGAWPRHFALGPGQRALYIANQNSGTITRLDRDPGTGRLSPTAERYEYPSVAMLTFG